MEAQRPCKRGARRRVSPLTPAITNTLRGPMSALFFDQHFSLGKTSQHQNRRGLVCLQNP